MIEPRHRVLDGLDRRLHLRQGRPPQHDHVKAERARKEAEGERQKGEQMRDRIEEYRASAELARQEAEEFRALAEEARDLRERFRADYELIRQEREALRIAAEETRIIAEEARHATIATVAATAETLKTNLAQMQFLEEARNTLRQLRGNPPKDVH